MQRVSLPSRLLGLGALLLVVAMLVVLLLASSSRPAYANTFTVNTESDLVDGNPGDGACDVLGFGICSLRAAVMEANALEGDDLIILPQGTYALTIAGADENDAASGDLDIGGFNSLTIEGGGTGSTLISGAGLDRVFHVLFFAELELQDLIVDGGAVEGTGGGISNSGTLRLIRINVANNTASEEGGGIYSKPATTGFFGAAGTITLTDSAVFSNVSAEGGGVFNGGSATITDSSIHQNAATVNSGGGITNQGTLTLSNVMIVDNTTPGLGGGIANEGTLNSTDSNFDRNTANGGGGIWISAGASLTLTGGGLLDNEATAQDGGGILNFGDAVISSATLESNRSSMLDGGAISSSGTLTIDGSTLSGNSAREGGGIWAFGAVERDGQRDHDELRARARRRPLEHRRHHHRQHDSEQQQRRHGRWCDRECHHYRDAEQLPADRQQRRAGGRRALQHRSRHLHQQ